MPSIAGIPGVSAAHERHKMAQAARRFWDALRAYVVAVRREHLPARRQSIGAGSDVPLEGVPILRLTGAILGLFAIVLILKAVQS